MLIDGHEWKVEQVAKEVKLDRVIAVGPLTCIEQTPHVASPSSPELLSLIRIEFESS